MNVHTNLGEVHITSWDASFEELLCLPTWNVTNSLIFKPRTLETEVKYQSKGAELCPIYSAKIEMFFVWTIISVFLAIQCYWFQNIPHSLRRQSKVDSFRSAKSVSTVTRGGTISPPVHCLKCCLESSSQTSRMESSQSAAPGRLRKAPQRVKARSHSRHAKIL